VVEVGLLVFLLTLGGVGFSILRRPDAGPTAFWTWGCFALFGYGLCRFILPDFRWSLPLGHMLGTAYPAFLLAGALVYAERRRPKWLLPVALALVLARGVFAEGVLPMLSVGIALVLEPAAVLAAAAYVFVATRGTAASLWQHALAPVLVVIAGLEAASAAWMMTGAALSMGLVGTWIVVAPLVLAVQIAAVSDRSQQALRRRHDELEQRVGERTAELARSVADLGAQVAERKRAEEALRARTALHNSIVESMSDGVVVLDTEFHIVRWNHAMEKLTGVPREKLIGAEQVAWEVFPHLAEQGMDKMLQRAMRGEVVEREFIPFRLPDGREGFTSETYLPLRVDGGEIRGIVAIIRDVTERKRAEEEQRRRDLHMREAQRLESLGLLAGGIAHDFNNMLTVIRGNSHLARADLESGVSPSPRLDRIQSAAGHAAALTEQVLTYSGKASVRLRPIDISQLTQDMLDLLHTSMAEKDTLELDLAEDLPAVEGDGTQIRQVILNLVTNASEALGEGNGTVRVRTRLLDADARLLSDGFGTPEPAAGEYVVLEVSDTGGGMDPALHARIFDPFFTTKSSGSGLGLAAVLGIVSAHRGVIRIVDEPRGGTTFQVLIPAFARRGEPVLAVREPVARATESGRILVVDDEPAVLELAHEFLQRSGFEVLTARGGREGVVVFRARSGEIDVVVLDVVMPEGGGVESLLEIRRIRGDVPVILTSGYDKGNALNAVQGLSADGISSFVRKPYESEELVESVCRAVAVAHSAAAREPSPGR
jgi:PAS domain S-box-containing protein